MARLHPRAFAWALRCSDGEREEGEDVLHAAYCKVLEGEARFSERSSFQTWLFGVIRITAREHRRWRWLRALRMERFTGEHSIASSNAEAVPEEQDEVTALRQALPRLSTRQQEVLHLVFYQELTIHEAADVLGVPVGTARTHYERGKARLRALLGVERR